MWVGPTSDGVPTVFGGSHGPWNLRSADYLRFRDVASMEMIAVDVCYWIKRLSRRPFLVIKPEIIAHVPLLTICGGQALLRYCCTLSQSFPV